MPAGAVSTLTWWRSAVNRSFFLCLAACRMRSSACDTLSRFCARRVLCWPAFPLAPALRSTDSAAGRSALFAGFIATMAGSDFSRPCIIGYGSSPSRCGPGRPPPGQTRDLPGSDAFLLRVMWSSTPAGATAPRITVPHMLPSAHATASASVRLTDFAAQSHTPHNRCVRFVAAVADGSRNTRYQAAATPYLDRTSTGWIAPASWRLP